MLSRVLLVVGLLHAVPLWSRSAAAAEPAAAEHSTAGACGEAFSESQRLSQKGKLQAALEQLISCAQPTCPPFLTRECTSTFERIKLRLPSVILVARDGSGAPLVDVSVSLDGKPLAERIEGLAFSLDPGLHEFIFQRPGEPPLKVTTLMSEGEQNKPVIAAFPSKEAAKGSSKPASPVPPPVAERRSGVPVATYVLGGLGVAAVAVGATFRLTGASDFNTLVNECERSCTADQVDPVKAKYVISTVSFGVGAAALIAAGVVFVTGRGDSRPTDTSANAHALSLRPDFLPGGGGGIVEGRF